MRGATDIEVCEPQTVRTIAGLHKSLLQALQKCRTVQLGLQAGTETDLTFVQLVEAARRHATAKGKAIALKEPASGSLREVLERGGFLAAPAARSFWLHEKGEC